MRFLNSVSFIFLLYPGPPTPLTLPCNGLNWSFAFRQRGKAPEPQAQLGEVDLKVDLALHLQATIAIVSMTTYPLHHTINDSGILLNGFYLK